MNSLEKLTLPNVLKESAMRVPAKDALVDIAGKSLAYKELYEKVRYLSGFLQNQGVKKGDRVAILSDNRSNWGVAFFAIMGLGAVAVPILPDFNTVEIHHIIRHSEAAAIFVSETLFHNIEGLSTAGLKTIILVDDFTLVPLRTKKDTLSKIMADGEKGLAKIKGAALRIIRRLSDEVGEEDLASIIYTSGTTGHSKGVMLSHKNIVYNALAATQIMHADEQDRLISILPLSHSYECTLGLVAALLVGASVYYLNKPPTARVLLPAMAEVKPTIMLAVPLVIEKIFKSRVLPELTRKKVIHSLYKMPAFRKRLHRIAGRKLLASFGGSLRCFCFGGAALSAEVELFLREARINYTVGYGLTETSPLATGTAPADTVFGSCGTPILGVDVKIDEPDPDTGEGEILVLGPNVMKGYYKDPERTAQVFTEDGWLKTGDLGYLDGNNYLFIRGRLKNVIIGPSGENIYPEEIESRLNEYEYVSESIVYQSEGQLVARVYLDYEKLDIEYTRQKLNESEIQHRIAKMFEDIRTYVNERVSSFSRINKIIEQTEPFEKTPTQKIKRYLYI